MKNYYIILGVLDDAEDIVIKAAYRALAQRYHPDKWQGNASEATSKMAEINEAFGILSDPQKRQTYDEQLKGAESARDAEEGENFSEEYTNEDEEAWAMAIDFFPQIKSLFQELRRISPLLANTFRLYLVASKDYGAAKGVKEKMELEHLSRFYGENRYVQAYAKQLLLDGHVKAAIELNKVVRFMGESIAFIQVKRHISQKFPESVATSPKAPPESQESEIDKLTSKAIHREISKVEAFKLIQHFFGNKPYEVWDGALLQNKKVVFFNGEIKIETPANKFLDYVHRLATDRAAQS